MVFLGFFVYARLPRVRNVSYGKFGRVVYFHDFDC